MQVPDLISYSGAITSEVRSGVRRAGTCVAFGMNIEACYGYSPLPGWTCGSLDFPQMSDMGYCGVCDDRQSRRFSAVDMARSTAIHSGQVLGATEVSSPLTASPDRASPSGKVTVSALSRTARRRAPRAKCVRVNPSLITVHLEQSAAARSVETCLRPHLADEGSPLLWWRARGWPAPCLWPSTNATHCSTLLYLMVTACCAPGGDLVLHVLSTGTAGDQRACRLANFGPPNTGAPWRDVPERYGPWGRACDLFRRWQRDGTWARIVTHLQAEADAKGLITWDLNVDSTFCRAHEHTAGPVKRGICKGTARRHCRRTGRPRPRTLPGRADDQGPPCRRARAEAFVGADHGWAARRLSAVRVGPGRDPGAADRFWSAS
jgi:hypothetical protein